MKKASLIYLLLLALLLCACSTKQQENTSTFVPSSSAEAEDDIPLDEPSYGEISVYRMATVERSESGNTQIERQIAYMGDSLILVYESKGSRSDFYYYDFVTGAKKKAEADTLFCPKGDCNLRVYDDGQTVLFTTEFTYENDERYIKDIYNIFDIDGNLLETYSWIRGTIPEVPQRLKNVFNQIDSSYGWCFPHFSDRFNNDEAIYGATYTNDHSDVVKKTDEETTVLFAKTGDSKSWQEYYIQRYNDAYSIVTMCLVEEVDQWGMPTKVQYKHGFLDKTDDSCPFGEYTDLRIFYAMGDGRLLMCNQEETAYYIADVNDDMTIGEPRLIAECSPNSVFAFSPDEDLFTIADFGVEDINGKNYISSVTLSLYNTETFSCLVSRSSAVDVEERVYIKRFPQLSDVLGPNDFFQGDLYVTPSGNITLNLFGSEAYLFYQLKKS